MLIKALFYMDNGRESFSDGESNIQVAQTERKI